MKSKMHQPLAVSDDMKRSAPRRILMVLLLLMFACAGSYQKLAAQQTQVSFQVFYDQLSPYGTWVDYPDYGYVWVPRGYPGFYPYATGGSWVYSDYGWTWVSDYSWGWAPFHYGRWYRDSYYGWLWVPGNEWGPAWVVWRNNPDYYGWAPMAPGWNLSANVGYNAPAPYWTFVSHRHFGHRDSYRYYAPRGGNTTIINNTTVINNVYVDKSRNTTYYSGPHREDVQHATGRPVHATAIKERGQPGQSMSGKTVSMYRPEIAANNGKDPNGPAPSKFSKPNEGKSVAGERPATGKPGNANPKMGEKTDQGISRQPGTGTPPQGKPESVSPKKGLEPQRQPMGNPKMNEGGNMPGRQGKPESNTPKKGFQQQPQPTMGNPKMNERLQKGQPSRKEVSPMEQPRQGIPDQRNQKGFPEQGGTMNPKRMDQPGKEMQSPRNMPQPGREMQSPSPRMMNPPPGGRPPQGQSPKQGRLQR